VDRGQEKVGLGVEPITGQDGLAQVPSLLEPALVGQDPGALEVRRRVRGSFDGLRRP
jgi:hypothetical protein